MAKFPEQTLGIVAINRPQAEEIEKELSILRDTDQIVSDYYYKTSLVALQEDDVVGYLKSHPA